MHQFYCLITPDTNPHLNVDVKVLNGVVDGVAGKADDVQHQKVEVQAFHAKHWQLAKKSVKCRYLFRWKLRMIWG